MALVRPFSETASMFAAAWWMVRAALLMIACGLLEKRGIWCMTQLESSTLCVSHGQVHSGTKISSIWSFPSPSLEVLDTRVDHWLCLAQAVFGRKIPAKRRARNLGRPAWMSVEFSRAFSIDIRAEQ